jgi:hypothetical protein
MTAVTIRGEPDIDIVLVARGARNRRVRACQWECRTVMVEYRRLPTRICRMARCAGGREPCVRNRRRRSGKRGGMTRKAVGGKPHEDIVLVAIGTCHCYMTPRKREWRVVVIECRGLPRCERVACRTVGRESRVRRSVRRAEIILMATYTCRWRPGVLPIFVALGARNSNVGPCKREYCLTVIKCRRLPGHHRVAPRAIRGKRRGNMGWCHCSIEVILMATYTSGRGARILSVLMALNTCNANMSSCQRKYRLVVVKCCRLPGHCRVAAYTVSRDPVRHMGRVDSCIELRLVTVDTSHRGARKPSTRMTLGTLDCHMCSRKRKRRLVMIEC